MVSEKSISLCMVIWNSSELTERAIDSVKSVIDEVVIVDQGSSEEHSKKLESLADVYIKLPNKGNADFDRQYCYSLARKDFILALDADEVITPENLELIKNIFKYKFEMVWFRFTNKVLFDGKEINLEKFLNEDPHPRLWKTVIQKNGQTISPIIWTAEAHKFPQILTDRIIYCEAKVDHIRELRDILKTHLHRGKNISPEARQVEKNFIRTVLNEFGLDVKKQVVNEFPELLEYLK
jgi:glycosyltransferase involved in cell wall biosynthesis